MRETVNAVKTPMKSRFSFSPKTDEEKEYIKVLEGLLEEKRRGDWQLVGEVLNVSAASAEKSFLRVYQKNHFEAVKALREIINSRKELLNTLKS